jgi:hypothetical protein
MSKIRINPSFTPTFHYATVGFRDEQRILQCFRFVPVSVNLQPTPAGGLVSLWVRDVGLYQQRLLRGQPGRAVYNGHRTADGYYLLVRYLSYFLYYYTVILKPTIVPIILTTTLTILLGMWVGLTLSRTGWWT